MRLSLVYYPPDTTLSPQDLHVVEAETLLGRRVKGSGKAHLWQCSRHLNVSDGSGFADTIASDCVYDTR